MASPDGKLKAIAGSEHPPLEGSRAAERPAPQEVARVTIYLRSRPPTADGADLEKKVASGQHLSHDEFRSLRGAHRSDLDRVEAFAEENGLHVLEASRAKRRVQVEGTIENLNRAFGVDLVNFEHDEGRHRGHEGEVHLPEDLHEIVVGVLGLDDRPMARRQAPADAADEEIGPDNLPEGAFTPAQVAEIYNFPRDLDGSGQCIGIVELGGGFFRGEFQKYFKGLGIPMPRVCTVGVSQPDTLAAEVVKDRGIVYRAPNKLNMEVYLDLEVAAAIAPGASYVFYFGTNDGAGFIDTIGEALLDEVHKPSVISVSWGAPEVGWPAGGAKIMENNIAVAAELGVTVCIASGDFGASEGLKDGRIAPSFPASVPWALSCGGTRLTASGNGYGGEVVWDQLGEHGRATGGGISTYFELPEYQRDAGVPAVPAKGAKPGFLGRGVPDVAGDADPRSGYLTYGNGNWEVHGGTSAVAPLWAALIAMINQDLGKRVGFLNEVLYELGQTDVFHQVTSGNNGYYESGPGWDACTGLGSPDGIRLLEALRERFA